MLARGWLTADTLSDVRCWRFTSPQTFARQIRRLVQDAAHDPSEAESRGADGLAWAEQQQRGAGG